MYTYRQILKQAFKIAWQNPSLWFFGLFVSILGGAGELEVLLGSSGFSRQGALFSFWQGLAQGGLFSTEGIKGLSLALVTNPLYLIALALVLLIILGLSALIIWLLIVSQSALVGQAINITNKNKLSWHQSFQFGLVKFWPVLGLNALMRAVIWFLFVLLGFLAFLRFPGSTVIFIFGFIIFLSLIVIISFITKYAICGVVLKDWQFKSSIKSAWELFTRNWLLSLEIAVILFLIYVVVNFLLFFFLSLIFFYIVSTYLKLLSLVFLSFLILVLILLFAQIILAIFSWSTWAIVFKLLTGQETKLISRLISGFKKLTSQT
jgi:hypothetical protein